MPIALWPVRAFEPRWEHVVLHILINRLMWAIPTILVIVMVNFVVLQMAPGDPIHAIIGEYPVSDEYVAAMREKFGLDQPIHTRAVLYLMQVVQLDLGYSFVNQQPVTTLVLQRALGSVALFVPAIILASFLGIVIARLAVANRGHWLDPVLNGVSLFGFSVPSFWMGQVLIVVFAVQLGALPAQGMFSVRGVHGFFPSVIDFIRHWVLPGLCVATFYLAIVTRVARSSIEEAQQQDFVTTALAKGVSARRTFWRHVLPNGLMPLITVIGYNFGTALTSTVMVETVFAWPGLGSLLMQSISTRDYPVVQAIFLLSATSVVIVNLITDLLYGFLDPRVRHAYRSGH